DRGRHGNVRSRAPDAGIHRSLDDRLRRRRDRRDAELIMAFALSLHAGDPARLATPLLAVALPSDKTVPRTLAPLDKALGGAPTRDVKQKDFKGNRDETLLLFAHGKGPQRVLLVGLGPSPEP